MSALSSLRSALQRMRADAARRRKPMATPLASPAQHEEIVDLHELAVKPPNEMAPRKWAVPDVVAPGPARNVADETLPDGAPLRVAGMMPSHSAIPDFVSDDVPDLGLDPDGTPPPRFTPTEPDGPVPEEHEWNEVEARFSHRAVETTLTAEQEAIATALSDSRQMVIAGPGTGKTFTVIRRLEYLLVDEGLDPQDILVLSFSRSAVHEITMRLQARVREAGAHPDLAFLQARTFDSFAYQLLADVGTASYIGSTSYEASIKSAAVAISAAGSGAREVVAGLRHIIVDELQDVVGARANLVKSILKAATGGFTLLADPAQAIYDWQVQYQDDFGRHSAGPTATALFKWLQEQAPHWNMQERTLTKNLRSSGTCFAVAERHRVSVLRESSPSRTLKALAAVLRNLPDSADLQSLADELRAIPPGRTAAILCRRNSEALQIHMQLIQMGVPHLLAANAEEVGIPAWVGRVLSTYKDAAITRVQFERLWVDRIGTVIPLQPGRAWQALVRAVGDDDDTRRLKMADLRRALPRRHDLPQGAPTSASPLTVSTIHRAKGREYDQVIVLDYEPREATWDAAEEARVLYVAATRPRERISSLRRDGIGRPDYIGVSRELAILPDGGVLTEIGRTGDVDDASIVSKIMFPGQDLAAFVQDRLWQVATVVGRPIVLIEHEQLRRGFTIRSRDTVVTFGMMSDDFTLDMQRLSPRLTEPVTTLKDVPVRAVETVISGNPGATLHQPYCQTGIYLTLRLQGAVRAGQMRSTRSTS